MEFKFSVHIGPTIIIRRENLSSGRKVEPKFLTLYASVLFTAQLAKHKIKISLIFGFPFYLRMDNPFHLSA